MIKVTGLKEVEANLRKLGSKDGTRVLRAGMLKATKPIEQAAKANVSSRSGALSHSIGSRFVIGKQSNSLLLPDMGGRFSVVIAPMRKSRVAVALYNLVYKRRRREIYHGHFLEFRSKFLGARPFLKPALDSKGMAAVASLAREIQAGIDRLLRKR